MKQKLKTILKKSYQIFFYSSFQKNLIRLKNYDRSGKIRLFKKTFNFHHGRAFYVTFDELFRQNIYKFSTDKINPTIIDCGANMGLSLLYFSMEYPNAKIIAFEPDEKVLPFLEQNILNYQLENVTLEKKAVWSSNTNLTFYTDEGMGGRLEISYSNQTPKTVETTRLKDFLKKEIDFLKIDIEGAEFEVLKDCKEELINVQNLFVEYHSFYDEEQYLDEILLLLKNQGFRYHLKESFSQKRPFVDKALTCEKYDMAINVFAYRKHQY